MRRGGDLGIGSWPARRARIAPERTVLVHGEQSWTYADLYERTERLARALRGLGVGPGDRVAYLGVNHPALLETLFAVGRLGAIFVPLNTRLAPVEIAYMLGDSGCCVLVHGAEMDSVAWGSVTEVPAVRHVVTVGSASNDELEYERLLADGGDGEPVEQDVSLEDTSMIIYTSGTTGLPKGAMITHGNLTWNTMNQLAHVDILSSDVALGVAPWFHTAGLNQVTMPTLFKGGQIVVAPKFDPGELLATVERMRITSFSAVPTMLKMIVEHPDWESTDVSSLRHVLYGGSPAVEWVARAWVDRGVPILQGYGLSETSPGIVMATAAGAAERPVSAGVPHFFTDVAVLGDSGPEPAPGASGEMVVRGPNVFTGYWQRTEETDSSFVSGDWFRTGDVVQVDDEGWTYVVDRIKDIFISGGENIYPAEVEAVLYTHPSVQSCAVVGVPDNRWGEVGLAFVVVREGAELTEDEATQHVRGRLAHYKVPKYVRFVDSIPTNATGKIRRVELRELAGELDLGQDQQSEPATSRGRS
ncbi:MAG: long-chain-fatty-acid--CoA ligase [Pseudonocardiaceae bacterium]|nr:long-chain-fatty-acid--CoA ligase [Pseudonocardiaceae bacterium]